MRRVRCVDDVAMRLCASEAVTHASDKKLRAEGATALASAFERNSTLQHLDVSSECRGDAGVCAVCGVWMMMRCDCARGPCGWVS